MLQCWFFKCWSSINGQKPASLCWLHFLSPTRPWPNLWKWRDTKYKIPVPILPLFSQFLAWRLPKRLLVFRLFRVLICLVTFLFAGIVFDMAQMLSFIFIFFCYLGGIDPSSWMASSPFYLAHFEARGLDLRLISERRRVTRFSLFFILIGSLIALLSIGVVLVFFD